MIRGTRQKQTRLSNRQRKSSSTRRVADSRGVSRRETVHGLRAKPGRKVSTVVVQEPRDVVRETALKNFGAAVRYFRRKNYQKASELFEKVASGPVREMADRARVHLSYCERQRRHERRPNTAEGCYTRGVAALNSRDFGEALEYLNKSDKMIPNQEYVHYALAAVYGLQGDPDNAYNHLEAAIKLRPQNRVQARHDEDFQTLADDPRFARLLGADARRPLA
jgi:tetratricopeptide (TPR) repeat protein